MNEEQFARLPKYARDEIEMLRHNVRSARQQMSDMIEQGDINTDTCIVDVVNGNTPLPRGTSIRFGHKAPGEWRNNITVRWSRNGNHLVVMGSDLIIVKPRAANVVHICGG